MEVLDELERRFAEAIERERAGAGAGSGAAGAAARGGRGRPRRPGWLRRLRLRGGLPLATGGALAALAVVAVAVMVALTGGGSGGTAVDPLQSAGRELLERVARAAERSAAPPVLRAGQYWYVRGEGVDKWAVRGRRIPGTRAIEAMGVARWFSVERWSGLGETARVRRLTLRDAAEFRKDQALWARRRQKVGPFQPDTDRAYTRMRGLPLQTGVFRPEEVRALPTTPQALLDAIEAAVRRATPAADADAVLSEEFETIAGLMTLPLRPAQRAALLRSFLLLPGTRIAGMGSDRLGRTGLKLVFTPRPHPKVPRVLVVSPRDGRLLALRGPHNSVETTYVAQGVAASVRTLPKGVAQPKRALPRTVWSDTPTPAIPGRP
jgi:hypothetical protein